MDVTAEVFQAAHEHGRRSEAELAARYGSLKPAAQGLLAKRNSRKCFDSADYAMTLNAMASGELPPDAVIVGCASPPPHPALLGGRGPPAPTRASTTG